MNRRKLARRTALAQKIAAKYEHRRYVKAFMARVQEPPMTSWQWYQQQWPDVYAPARPAVPSLITSLIPH